MNGVDNAIVISGELQDGDEKHGLYDVIIIEGGVQKLSEKLEDTTKRWWKNYLYIHRWCNWSVFSWY